MQIWVHEQKLEHSGGTHSALGFRRRGCFLDDDLVIGIVNYSGLNCGRLSLRYAGHFLLPSFFLRHTLSFPNLAKIQDALL